MDHLPMKITQRDVESLWAVLMLGNDKAAQVLKIKPQTLANKTVKMRSKLKVPTNGAAAYELLLARPPDNILDFHVVEILPHMETE